MQGSDRSTSGGKRHISKYRDLIPSIPMCGFCYLSRDWTGQNEDVYYVCSSSASDRRFLTFASWNGTGLICSTGERTFNSPW